MVALVLVSAALAGERVELWRGFQGRIPFGDPAVLADAPLPGCVPGVAPVVWACPHDVGTVPVLLQFMVNEGLYTAWSVYAESWANCSELQRIVVGQYAGAMHRTRVDGLANSYWRERQVDAAFEWDATGTACFFRAEHRRSMKAAGLKAAL